MEENNKTKISFTSIWFVISIIILIAMGLYIYEIKKDLLERDKRIVELSQVINDW